jgi:tetratricopeptide (TPR) repeat protein
LKTLVILIDSKLERFQGTDHRRSKIMKKHKIWVGIGAAVLAGTPVATGTALSANPAMHETHAHGTGHPVLLAQAKSHGEMGASGHGATPATTAGGEGEGAKSGENLAPALRFYRDIQLIRGHLGVGDELVQSGRWADALPHFAHPTEEIYSRLGNDLKTYDIAPFAVALKALTQTVKAKNKEAYARALQTVNERLVTADRNVKAKEANWTYFALETALEVLKEASEEFEKAYEGKTLKLAVEYQDSRGFVWAAEKLVESVSAALAAKDAEGLKAIRAAFADLKNAWPAPMPPKEPVKDYGEVLADISRIELQLGRFH